MNLAVISEKSSTAPAFPNSDNFAIFCFSEALTSDVRAFYNVALPCAGGDIEKYKGWESTLCTCIFFIIGLFIEFEESEETKLCITNVKWKLLEIFILIGHTHIEKQNEF